MKYELWKRINYTGKQNHNVWLSHISWQCKSSNGGDISFDFFGMVRCVYLTGRWWNMNCKRELITLPVAPTAPLTITKYNKTLDKEYIMCSVLKCMYLAVTILCRILVIKYLLKEEKKHFSLLSYYINIMGVVGNFCLNLKWNLDMTLLIITGSYSCHDLEVCPV